MPPILGRQSAADQQMTTSPLQDANSHLCGGVGVRVVALRHRLVDRMFLTVLREFIAQKLSSLVAVQSKEEGVWEVPVVIIDLG